MWFKINKSDIKNGEWEEKEQGKIACEKVEQNDQ